MRVLTPNSREEDWGQSKNSNPKVQHALSLTSQPLFKEERRGQIKKILSPAYSPARYSAR